MADRKKPADYGAVTKRWCERHGWIVGLVERYVSFSRTRHDLFGFIDYMAIDPAGRTLALQVTRRSVMAHRYRKIEVSENVDRVLAAGWLVEVWGWDKRDGRWRLKRMRYSGNVGDWIDVTDEDFGEHTANVVNIHSAKEMRRKQSQLAHPSLRQ